ncbi:MAG: hypothetical protein DHS20C13_27270 [Thermodesulfobacteriota bacterium]|nr:MAG: hypothetical protein DHS20C13_27270 [Thermodesulfobacteriota bacterium]
MDVVCRVVSGFEVVVVFGVVPCTGGVVVGPIIGLSLLKSTAGMVECGGGVVVVGIVL